MAPAKTDSMTEGLSIFTKGLLVIMFSYAVSS
jgi:hypothetical protein